MFVLSSRRVFGHVRLRARARSVRNSIRTVCLYLLMAAATVVCAPIGFSLSMIDGARCANNTIVTEGMRIYR